MLCSVFFCVVLQSNTDSAANRKAKAATIQISGGLYDAEEKKTVQSLTDPSLHCNAGRVDSCFGITRCICRHLGRKLHQLQRILSQRQHRDGLLRERLRLLYTAGMQRQQPFRKNGQPDR